MCRFVVALSLAFSASEALVGYDCRTPGLSRPYLTTSPHECSELGHPLTRSTPEAGFVAQIPVKGTTTGKMCMVQETSRRFYCSYERNLQHRLDATMFSGYTPSTVSITDCRIWWAKGSAKGPWGERRIGNGETVIAIKDDLMTDDGWCKNWKETIEVKGWRITKAEVQVTSVYDESGLAQNYLSQEQDLILMAGPGQGTTAAGATIFWDTHDLVPCKLEIIREGEFNISTTASGTKWAVASTAGSALRIGAPVTVCGQHLYSTSEPFTFYGNLRGENSESYSAAKVGRISTALNSRVNYALLALLSGDHSSQRSSVESLCRLEAEIRRIHLTDAGVTPAQLAYRTFGSPGKALHRAGEGFRLASCESIDIKIAPQPICYDLIPVKRTNSSVLEFLDPTVMSLHSTAKKIECNDPSLPIISFGGASHELSPDLKLIPSPSHLPSSVRIANSTADVPLLRLYKPHVLMNTDLRVTMVEAAKQRSDFLANSWERVAQITQIGREASPGDSLLTTFRNGVLGHIGWTSAWLIILTISQVLMWWRARQTIRTPVYTHVSPSAPSPRSEFELLAEISRTRSPHE
ncbi:putative glycoprotein [Beihai barnacle virus 8]|uniref:Putative glycoprotein n=1 Tax=Beihai barnacle virus 8 TaxID=1922366 RepID=A0A1L3KMP7_9MONO|nr:putative glycoprotein [Beihai barnacle virus 8]APG78658.1 putative glycoprotein [Beihai barnacle virus 8]